MVTLSEIEKYLVLFKDILFYLPGEYKITFYAKSNEIIIPIGVVLNGEIHTTNKDSYSIDEINTPDGKERVSLGDVGIFLDLDKEIFVYQVYLYIEIERVLLTEAEDGDASLENAERKIYVGKILLSKRKTLFRFNASEEPGVVIKYNGTIHFYTDLNVESIKVIVGCIKYTLSRIFEKQTEDIVSPVPFEEEGNNLIMQKPQLNTIAEEIKDKNKEEVLMTNEREVQHEDLVIPSTNFEHKVEVPIHRIILHKEDLLNIDSEFSEVYHHDEVIAPKKPVTPTILEPPLLLKKKTHTIAHTGIDFPDVNSIKQLLPKYHSLKHNDHRTSVVSHVPIKEPDHLSTPKVVDILHAFTPERLSLSPQTKESLDSHVLAVLDYQAKELDRYRNVIQKMGNDIMNLRQEISDLEDSKSQILNKLYYAGEGVGDGSDNEVVLQRRFAAQVVEKDNLQDRVHNLQNDMIKKNEIEVSYYQLQKAHETQQKFVQDCQGKMEKYAFLQETIKKQEQVIEKLEERMNAMQVNTMQGINLSPKRKAPNDPAVNKNQILGNISANRNEVVNVGVSQKMNQIYFDNSNPCTGCKQVHNQFEPSSIDERISMMQKIQQSELKIQTLEEQLQKNAIDWVKERSNLQNGFSNSYSYNSNNHNNSYLSNNNNNFGQYQLTQFPQRWSSSWNAQQ